MKLFRKKNVFLCGPLSPLWADFDSNSVRTGKPTTGTLPSQHVADCNIVSPKPGAVQLCFLLRAHDLGLSVGRDECNSQPPYCAACRSNLAEVYCVASEFQFSYARCCVQSNVGAVKVSIIVYYVHVAGVITTLMLRTY
jgi:hypothetical protein